MPGLFSNLHLLLFLLLKELCARADESLFSAMLSYSGRIIFPTDYHHPFGKLDITLLWSLHQEFLYH